MFMTKKIQFIYYFFFILLARNAAKDRRDLQRRNTPKSTVGKTIRSFFKLPQFKSYTLMLPLCKCNIFLCLPLFSSFFPLLTNHFFRFIIFFQPPINTRPACLFNISTVRDTTSSIIIRTKIDIAMYFCI